MFRTVDREHKGALSYNLVVRMSDDDDDDGDGCFEYERRVWATRRRVFTSFSSCSRKRRKEKNSIRRYYAPVSVIYNHLPSSRSRTDRTAFETLNIRAACLRSETRICLRLYFTLPLHTLEKIY